VDYQRTKGPSILKNPYVTVKPKSPTSEERWEDRRLINGGTAHPFRLIFWGEGNGPVTGGIRVNPRPDSDVSPSAPTGGVGKGPICNEGVTGLGGGECHV